MISYIITRSHMTSQLNHQHPAHRWHQPARLADHQLALLPDTLRSHCPLHQHVPAAANQTSDNLLIEGQLGTGPVQVQLLGVCTNFIRRRHHTVAPITPKNTAASQALLAAC